MRKLTKYTFIYELAFLDGFELKKVIWAITERSAFIKFRAFYTSKNISIENLRVTP